MKRKIHDDNLRELNEKRNHKSGGGGGGEGPWRLTGPITGDQMTVLRKRAQEDTCGLDVRPSRSVTVHLLSIEQSTLDGKQPEKHTDSQRENFFFSPATYVVQMEWWWWWGEK